MSRLFSRGWRAIALASLGTLIAAPGALAQFDEETEGRNYAKTAERERYVTKTPEFQARLAQQEAEDNVDLAQIAAAEAPQGEDARNFTGNICFQRKRECAGDVRFYDWEANGFGMSKPLLFGGRSGATLSARVWATPEGPAKRPGVVITTGSVQAPETLYWGIAAALAKNGYVVLTYDVQGQGRSDTYGAGADQQEGFPSQSGRPFYDGTEDALDFLLSKPGSPYVPRPSCTTGTSHADKHDKRVAAGLNAAFNPFHDLVDPERIGIAGHSLGAGAVSFVGQKDPRVDAIVAWDNLGQPRTTQTCPLAQETRTEAPITKPAIGMSNDYGLVATPNQSLPSPEGANVGFQAYKDAGVDSMQINRRGGTHYEYSFIPGQTAPALGLATLRGMDMATWYTVAWFDRYVKGDVTAADRLLTDRWRNDKRDGEVDQSGDANMYSFYKTSRYDIADTDGSRAICDDVRSGCASMGPDGLPADYSQLDEAYTASPASAGGGSGGGSGSGSGSGGGAPGPDGPGACALAQGGAAGRDTLRGTDAGDALRGGGGNDRLRGGKGDDCLYGEGGNDRLRGDDDDDELKGGSGTDRLVGGEGSDILRGAKGRDTLKAVDGERDVVRCGGGRHKDFAKVDKRDDVRGCERVRVKKAKK